MAFEPVTNDLDFLKGCKPYLRITPYVTAGGAITSGAWIDIGSVSDVEYDFDGTVKEIEDDTSVFSKDAFLTKVAASMKFTMHEADLRKLLIVLGNYDPETSTPPDFSDPVNPAIIEVVNTGTLTDGTATGLVGEPVLSDWRISLGVGNQSFRSDPTLDNIYTQREVIFWRGKIIPKVKHAVKRDDWVKTGAEVKIFRDSSITTRDKLFKIIDTCPHVVAP